MTQSTLPAPPAVPDGKPGPKPEKKSTAPAATATAPAPAPAKAPAAPAATETKCPGCGSTEPWGRTSWCPSCGYYPALGKKGDAPPETVPGTEPAGPTNVWQVIPGWLWIFAGGVVVITALSIWAALTLGDDSAVRTLWTLAQALIGLMVFGIAHLSAYMLACTKTDKIGPFDYFMKPVEIWKPSIRQLPAGWNRVCLGGWSSFAIFAAFVFIGGIDINAVFEKDWGFEKQAQANLLHAIVDEARKQKEGAEENLEGAMNQFVGEGEPKEDKNKPLPAVECVVIGYVPTDDAEVFSAVVLASLVEGKLRYVGTVSSAEIPEEHRDVLRKRMPRLQQERPLVKSPVPANWLRPVLLCRVNYSEWSSQKQLKGAVFEKMLADLK